MTELSSSTSAGIFPSGLMARSFASAGSVTATSFTRGPRSSSWIMIRAFRAYGELGEKRSCTLVPLKGDESRHFLAEGSDLVGASEFRQINHEAAADDFRPCALQQLNAGECGAAGGDEIVHHDDVLSLPNGVFVNLNAVGAVFERVILAHGLPGK